MRHLVRHMVARSLALVTVLATAATVQMRRMESAAEWVDHTDRAIAQANLAQRLMIDKEAGVRAYLLAREPRFLRVYEEARPVVALEQLERLIADSPEQVQRVRSLRQRYLDWLASAEEALANPAEGSTLDALIDRKREMDAIRGITAAFVEEEEGLRTERVARVAREARIAEIGGGVLLLLAGAAMVLASRRELHRVIGVYDAALAKSAASEAAVKAAADRERAAREQAEQALRLKDEFLWSLSHELRTPLTAVLGWTSILRTSPKSGAALERALAVIERGARAEARIVDDLLDASRIATGKVQLVTEPMVFEDAAAAAIDLCRDAAANKGVLLDFAPVGEARPGSSAPVDRAVVMGDPHRLQQVAWNLVSNAVKFTPRGGRVEVRSERRGDRIELVVRDTGDGIAPAFLPHVFERFRQADSSMKRAHGGLGLGLSIAKHLVELHGGTITAESEGAGRGATFTVSLPLAPDGARPLPAARAEARGAGRLEGLRVLLVEDDPDSLALAATVLREHGAQVLVAARGGDALGLLDREPVDLLVSDIGLPDIDGYELLQRARAERSIPALALTAYAGSDDRARAERAGFERHMAKPWSPERLVQVVSEMTPPTRASGPPSPPRP